MVKKLPEKSKNQPKNILEKAEKALISWLEQKETGKFIIEINANEGGITKCVRKIEANF